MTGYRYAYFVLEQARSAFRLAALLAVLNVGLVLPSLAVFGSLAGGFDGLVSFDLIVLFALILLANRTSVQRGARYLATGGYVLLLGYELYDAAIQIALKRPGILYDDIQHIVGSIHLVGNAAEPVHLVAGALGLGMFGGFCWFAVRAFRLIEATLDVRIVRHVSVAGVSVSLAVLMYALAFDRGDYVLTYEESVVMIGEKIAGNVKASIQLRDRVLEFSDHRADSTYAQYETVQLSRRPHLFILFIESYGDVLRRNEETAAPYRTMMQELDERLSRTGWQSASAMSLAPVNGGTSWLSVGSVLMGMPIKHQSMFNFIESDIERYPHLIHTLQAHGYQTAALQPPTRSRLGVGVSNPYRFDRTFYFQDMQYTGPRYGWGIVPDQYSLNLTHEQFVAPAEGPVALMFEMVTSHTPWEPPPPLVDDWRTLNNLDPDALPDTRSVRMTQDEQMPVGTAQVALAPLLPNMSAEKNAPIHRLFRTIRYDWQVISEYMINEMPDSSLVVVLGDHQPPVVSTKSNAVPVHIFSQTSDYVNAAISNGFQQGLLPKTEPMQPTTSTPSFRHAGLYSLVMNLLAQPSGSSDSSRSLSVLPNGVQRPAPRLSVSP